jgi:serine protease inhibitor ecotin
LLNFEKSSTFSQTCFGTIGTSSAAMVACGFFSSMTSLVGLGAVTFSKFATKLPFAVPAPSSVIIVLKVHAASSAVTRSPSDHLEFSRIV